MEHQVSSPEISYGHEPVSGTKRIWKTFWILLLITAIELGLGLIMYAMNMEAGFTKNLVKGIIIILSLAKAFYIVGIFMHLGDEIRNMVMTIVVPLLLFIWFILAFLWDGGSYKELRNKYDPHFKEQTSVPTHNDAKAKDTIQPAASEKGTKN
jgi:cytochrome c oxidase subunit IV